MTTQDESRRLRESAEAEAAWLESGTAHYQVEWLDARLKETAALIRELAAQRAVAAIKQDEASRLLARSIRSADEEHDWVTDAQAFIESVAAQPAVKHVSEFGAVVDGKTDDTDALQRAVQFAAQPEAQPARTRGHLGSTVDGGIDDHDEAQPAVATSDSEVQRVPREWRSAMRKLVFMARTSGGIAGADAGLMKACEEAEALLALPYLPAENEETSVQGTFSCPICGHDKPHGHYEETIAAYREDQMRSDGWTSTAARRPKRDGWYLCMGVTIPLDQAGTPTDSQLHWFHWVREGAARTRETEVPEVLYFASSFGWSLRNLLGNASYSGDESRWRVQADAKYWREVPPLGIGADRSAKP